MSAVTLVDVNTIHRRPLVVAQLCALLSDVGKYGGPKGWGEGPVDSSDLSSNGSGMLVYERCDFGINGCVLWLSDGTLVLSLLVAAAWSGCCGQGGAMGKFKRIAPPKQKEKTETHRVRVRGSPSASTVTCSTTVCPSLRAIGHNVSPNKSAGIGLINALVCRRHSLCQRARDHQKREC